LLWIHDSPDVITTPPIAAFGEVVVGAANGTVFFLDQDSGRETRRVHVEGTPVWVGFMDESPQGEARIVAVTRRSENQTSIVYVLEGNRTVWKDASCYVGYPNLVDSTPGGPFLLFTGICGTLQGLIALDLDTGSPRLVSSTGSFGPPRLGDLDGDGVQEIAIQETATGWLHVMSENGTPLWHKELNRVSFYSPILADFACRGDRQVLLPMNYDLTLGLEANLSAYDRFGSLLWWRTVPQILWPVDILPSGVAAVALRSPPCKDVVVVTSDGVVQAVSGRDGGVLWSERVEGALGVVGADVSGDGRSDVVVFQTGNRMTALGGLTGEPLWTLHVQRALEVSFLNAAVVRGTLDRVRIVVQGRDWTGIVGTAPREDQVVFFIILGIGATAMAIPLLWFGLRRLRSGPKVRP